MWILIIFALTASHDASNRAVGTGAAITQIPGYRTVDQCRVAGSQAVGAQLSPQMTVRYACVPEPDR